MQLKRVNVKVPKAVKSMIDKKKAIHLDVGCGPNKIKGSVGMDIRPLEGVDIVHNFNQYPWPIPDESCSRVTAVHVLEHVPKHGTIPQVSSLIDLLVKKKLLSKAEVNAAIGETEVFSFLMRFLDESWRVLQEGGQIAAVLPYANSIGFFQDPTHTSAITEATFFYFDPTHESRLYEIYRPKPWKIDINTYQLNGNIEVVMTKMPMTPELEAKSFENNEKKDK